jgi:hypothetical protein
MSINLNTKQKQNNTFKLELFTLNILQANFYESLKI